MLDFSDRRLFGNEAGEDEDPVALKSYFVDKPEFRSFEDESVPLHIARARKGVGKSALLAYVAHTKATNGSQALVISLKGGDLPLPDRVGASANTMVRDWQQSICNRIALEIGRQIGFAVSDTDMTLVEYAEITGFRGRSLIRAIVDRLKFKFLPVEVSRPGVAESEPLVHRFMEATGSKPVWLFIDDIDATFQRSTEECLRLSTFFTACRMLCNTLDDLRLRTSVRTDVWATVRNTDEALDKCEQYMTDITWSNAGTRTILINRIRAYLDWIKFSRKKSDVQREISPIRQRLIAEGVIKPASPQSATIYRPADHADLSQIFPERFPWGKGTSPAYHVIHVYSAGRPRWALQLCKLAGREALATQSPRIEFGHIKEVLEKYGRFRIDDLVREHRHQCPQIEEVIQAFARNRITHSTAELLAHIDRSVLRHMKITLDHVESEQSPLAVAHFLFRIGFIGGRLDRGHSVPLFYRYDEKPHLLKTPTNVDEGMTWEIHPSYRKALRLLEDG